MSFHKCCICKNQVNLTIHRNPWGDLCMVCKSCITHFYNHWKELGYGEEE
jgi:hypothetical protein